MQKNKNRWSVILCMTLLLCTTMMTAGALTAHAAQATPYPATLQNGDFENNPNSTLTAATQYFIPSADVPGWETTDSLGQIELWHDGFMPGQPGGIAYNAQSGVWFAEINANDNCPAAIWQDLSTVPGTLYQWSFWHRGRVGTDTAMMLLGPRGTLTESDAQPALVNATEDYTGTAGAGYTGPTGPTCLTAARSAWTQHLGYYIPTTDATRYELYSYASAAPDKYEGNLVDNANWIPIASPTTQTIHVGDGTPADDTLIQDLADGFTFTPRDVPDSSTPGTYAVPVDIVDASGNIIGTITSTVIVLEAETPPSSTPSDEPSSTPSSVDPTPSEPPTSTPSSTSTPSEPVTSDPSTSTPTPSTPTPSNPVTSEPTPPAPVSPDPSSPEPSTSTPAPSTPVTSAPTSTVTSMPPVSPPPTSSATTDNPKTGDNSGSSLPFYLLGAAALTGFVILVVSGKKKLRGK